MPSIRACLILLGVVVAVPAAEPSLKEARQRWLHGNYDEARELYQELAKDAATKAAAGLASAGPGKASANTTRPSKSSEP